MSGRFDTLMLKKGLILVMCHNGPEIELVRYSRLGELDDIACGLPFCLSWRPGRGDDDKRAAPRTAQRP